MKSALQNQIKTRMHAKALSIAALEREAGLKVNAVRNILSGQSKKPSAETLQAVANVLECSVRDLLEKDISNISLTPHVTKNSEEALHEWIPKLFDDCVQVVQGVIDSKKYIPSAEEMFFLVKEVYFYSLDKNAMQVDQKFAEWFIDRNVAS